MERKNTEQKEENIDKTTEYLEEYKRLCEKYGYMITTTPTFILRDDGTYSVRLNTGISPYTGQR